MAGCLTLAPPAGAVRFARGQRVVIVAPAGLKAARDLARYTGAVLGVEALITEKGEGAIVLRRTQEAGEGFSIVSAAGRITVTGGERGLRRGVQRLVLKSRQIDGALEFPDLTHASSPWIAEREWTVCPWVPQHVRGAFVNPYADNRLNLWLYSDRQLADYVAMFDWLGYSGVQLMETAYSYAVMGSPEAFHGRQRALARLARENGQNVSLWVWAAEFSGFGHADPDVVYEPEPGKNAFDDPRVRRGFERYYDLYAELAPYVDRLIGHFYDPGRLRDRADVFRYMRLLEGKFKARNPHVRMAIDSWAAGLDYLQALIDNGFTDYLLLLPSMPMKPGQREAFHREARRLGLKIGVWGWYTTEYETDQLASMYVNARVLRSVYGEMRNGALAIHPAAYWSEMEAHHLNNIYSMYAAAQLLWDPNRDPDEILAEIAEAIWGPRNGIKVLEALKLIQEARSGDTWDTYWWRMPGYRLGTDNPAGDLRRAEAALKDLRGLDADPGFVPKLPLPFPPAVFADLMVPHLQQIRDYARFRLEPDPKRWVPIPEYNTWIGTFGQPEARMQEILLRERAAKGGGSFQEPAWVKARDAQRLLEKARNMQRARRGEWRFQSAQLNEFWWTPEKLQSRFDKLVADGWFVPAGEGLFRLAAIEP